MDNVVFAIGRVASGDAAAPGVLKAGLGPSPSFTLPGSAGTARYAAALHTIVRSQPAQEYLCLARA